MKLIAPNYYQKFKCIANACTHNCCIGWEIDIDEDTLEFYQSLKGAFGKRLKESISPENTPHFILGAGERCPFLNHHNLCDIICELGEGGLCQICADHPRFRNDFSDRTEIGLGLCCEAAGRLILEQTEKVTWSVIEEDGHEDPCSEAERAFFDLRRQIFDTLQDRRQPIHHRIDAMLQLCGGVLPESSLSEWAAVYQSLERLDPAWDEYLARICPASLPAGWEIPLEQLAVYFTYRHLAGALEDGLLAERAALIVLSLRIIEGIAAAEERLTPERFAEIARLYSSEIEYSDENIQSLLNSLTVR